MNYKQKMQIISVLEQHSDVCLGFLSAETEIAPHKLIPILDELSKEGIALVAPDSKAPSGKTVFLTLMGRRVWTS